jgi:hypothetical protein
LSREEDSLLQHLPPVLDICGRFLKPPLAEA